MPKPKAHRLVNCVPIELAGEFLGVAVAGVEADSDCGRMVISSGILARSFKQD